MKRSLIYVVPTGALVVLVSSVALSGRSTAAKPAMMLLNSSHQCSFCHTTHSAPAPNLLNDTNVEDLCLSCHGPGGPSIFKADTHKGQTCMVCHNPHDGEFNRFGNRNIKMVRAEVLPRESSTTRPMTFESRGTDAGEPVLHSFCDDDLDGDAIYDNACDTCHRDSPDIHRYTRPNSHGHNTGRTCTVCHFHDNGFDADD